MLKKGIYENIINQRMEREIRTAETENLVCVREEIDNTEAPQMLADYLAKAIRQKLQETEDLQDRMAIINRILTEYGLIEDVQITDTSNLLMEVMTQEKNLLQQNSRSETIRPQSGFRVSNLFTGGNSALSLGEEIRREIASADEIYFIVSFLKVSGLRLLLEDLKNSVNAKGPACVSLPQHIAVPPKARPSSSCPNFLIPKSEFLTRPKSNVCMPKLTSLYGIPVCIRPTSVHPTCPSPPRPTDWSGTCASPA